MTKRILLLDVAAILHQIKFSLSKKKLSNDEKSTFIIYGFLLKLAFLRKKIKSNVIVYATDSNTSKRKEMYSEYKEKRKHDKTDAQIALDKIAYPQFDEIINYVIPTIGYRNIFGANGFEADDIIGKICKTYKESEIVICSTDQDFYQLLRQNTTMFNVKTSSWFTQKDFMTKYGLEPKMWKRVKSYGGCFDKKTEILTDRGWVQFPNIKKSDKVYSMNPISRNASYEKITKQIKYIYKGDMYKIKGKIVDFLVTPNHKFFGSITASKEPKPIIKFKEIQDIIKYKNFTIPLTSIWTGIKKDKFTLPEIIIQWKTECKTSIRVFNSIDIDMNIWLSFLGIYLVDGHVSKNKQGNLCIVEIATNKQNKIDYFMSILNSTPWQWTKCKTGWRSDNVQLAGYLKQLETEKYIPREFLDLSTEQLQILFDSFIFGNGSVSIEKNICGKEIAQKTLYSNSKKLINDIQEIAIKLGHSTIITSNENIKEKSGLGSITYQLKINKINNTNLLNTKITKEYFNDFVYDVTTEPFHTILVRRNNVVAWSSNCSSDNVKGVPIPQSDPLKKQRHVAEAGALSFIKGKMNPNTQAYKAIVSKKGKKIIKRNKKLVILPFKGTPDFPIRTDFPSIIGFKVICRKYGFDALLADLDYYKTALRLR